jgi:hypothetical protein
MSRANWWPRLWPNVVNSALLAGALQATPGLARLECVLPDDGDARVYRLVDRGASASPRWWLTLRARSLGGREVELPLAGAQVEESKDGALRLASRSLNGGVAIEIRPEATAYRLDVFVNFELEVNVWRDLSPDVEHMNTAGARSDARCQLLSLPKGLS